MNKAVEHQLRNIKENIFCLARIVKVKERDEWYGQKKIICKIWNNYQTNVRIMFMSMDDKAKYKDFDCGDKVSSWLSAMDIYSIIPKIIDHNWFEKYGFEDF